MNMDKEQTRQMVLSIAGLASILFRFNPRVLAAANFIQFLAMSHWDELWAIYKANTSPKPLLMQQWVPVPQ